MRNDSAPASFFRLRRMICEDIAQVMAIERMSFSNPWHESTFCGEIQNRPFSYPYVLEHSELGKIIGYIIYWQIKDEVQINNVAVHPDFRKRGAAEAALHLILDEVKARGAVFVTLEVRASNALAIALYKKLGFQIVGVRKAYYSNPLEDAIVMGFIPG